MREKGDPKKKHTMLTHKKTNKERKTKKHLHNLAIKNTTLFIVV